MLQSKKRNERKWKRLKTRNHIVLLEQLFQTYEEIRVVRPRLDSHSTPLNPIEPSR